MKKILSLISVMMVMFTSCTNDINEQQLSGNETVRVCAQINLSFDGEPQMLSSKSRDVDTYRYVMEVYSDENHQNKVGEQQTSQDGNFNLTLDRTKNYYVLLWADVNGDDIYDMNTLKSVTLKSGEHPVEAFCGKTTIEGNNSTISVTLNRCVGKVTLLETGKIDAGFVNVKFSEPTSFNVSTGEVGSVKERSQTFTFDEKNGTNTPVALNDKSIYILANNESCDITFTMQYTSSKDGSTPEDEIAVTTSIVANRNTNIKGHYTSVQQTVHNFKSVFTKSDYYQCDAYAIITKETDIFS